ncbi:hypothetical protein MTO96_037573, partial [Rhipicephalus appendiculatus]
KERTGLGHPREPLEGFGWKHGRERQTSGIRLWSEVFLVSTSDDQEVAVVFMDTQGLFDSESTVAQNTTIFALSVLTSSVQIYNIFHNIQEDHLQHLEYFTQYGQLAQKESTGKPFQRLVFLVRDSNDGTYGADAGRSLITERLNATKDRQPEHQQLREYISDNFSAIDCFLMPYPGSKVATEHSYDGCVKDIDEEFKNHLQEFVPWILGPEHLVVKKINGKTITCQELLTYIKAYAQVFRSGELPEPKSMLQATAEASHLTAKDKATKVYMTVMSNIPRGDLEKLRSVHEDALTRAQEVFDGIQKIGGYRTSKAYLDTLINELQEHFGRLYETEQAWLDQKNEEEKARREQEAENERKKQLEVENEIRKARTQAERKSQKEKEVLELQHTEELRSMEIENERVKRENNKLTTAVKGVAIGAAVAAVALSGGAAGLAVAGIQSFVACAGGAGVAALGSAACVGTLMYKEKEQEEDNAKAK